MAVYAVLSSVDPAEDQKAEPDTSFPANAVLSIWADLSWPWQATGWLDSSPRHCWYGEVWVPTLTNLLTYYAVPKAITCFFCFDRLKDVQSLDELGDVYNHFLLYYGRDIPKMQNATKVTKKKLKKIKEVSEEDGTAVCFWMRRLWCSTMH